jgi:hypothetical protein
MQVEKEAQAAATGHEEKSSATGDNEQALAEAQSSATGQRRKDDKLLLHPPEIVDETSDPGTDEVAGWITGAFPSIFQNESGDPYNFKLAKTDLVTWGPHVLRSRGWSAHAHMIYNYHHLCSTRASPKSFAASRLEILN